MTRREWLQKYPPPKAAKTIRELLDQATSENNVRLQIEVDKSAHRQNVQYWNSEFARAQSSGDAVLRDYASGQLKEHSKAIEDLDKKLSSTANLTARIAQLTSELGQAAKCPVHSADLVRHKNRPDDLFICEIGPHFFLWTNANGAAAGKLVPLDMTQPMPGLDDKMDGWL